MVLDSQLRCSYYMSEKIEQQVILSTWKMFDTAASNEALCLASRPNLALDPSSEQGIRAEISTKKDSLKI